MASSTCKNFEELLYTQRLVDVDDKVRGNAIKRLKEFLKFKSSTTGFKYEDFLKIWKGLYYCMYMADKPLVQEDLADNISNMIHHITDSSQKLLFFQVALDTFSREWKGIDKFRMDKFFMLVTRVLRQLLIFLRINSWNEEEVKEASAILESSIICPFDKTNEKPLGLKLHITEIILEELAKVGKETLPDKVLITMIFPFFKVIAVCNDKTYNLAVKNRIVYAIIKQGELGLKNQKYLSLKDVELVKNMDSVETKDENQKVELVKNIDSVETEDENQEVELVKNMDSVETKDENQEEIMDCDEDNDEEFVMDPRAGQVDVHLPLLRPDYNKVAEAFLSLTKLKEISKQKRETLRRHANKFITLSKGFSISSFPRVKEFIPKSKLIKDSLKKFKKLDEEFSKKRELEDADEETEIVPIRIKVPRLEKKKKKKKTDKKLANIERMHMLSKKKKLSRRRRGKKIINKPIKGDGKKQEKELGRKNYVLTHKLKELSVNLGKDKIDASSSVPLQVKNEESNNKNLKLDTTNKKYVDRKNLIVNNEWTVTKFEKKIPISQVNEIQNPKSGTVIKKKNPKSGTVSKPKNLKKTNDTTNTKHSLVLKPVDNSTTIAMKMKKVKIIKVKTASEKKGLIKKNEWDEPLQEGEIEFEVRTKKYAKKLNEKPTLIMKKSPKVNKKGRTLKINLQKNMEHEFQDYKRAVASSPGIPFSALKKPVASVLKVSPSPNLAKKSCASKVNKLKKKYKL